MLLYAAILIWASQWIKDDLKVLRPPKSLFINDALRHLVPSNQNEVHRHAWQGLNCRFGSRGIIAEAHYDAERNFIAMLKGAAECIADTCTNTAAGSKRFVLLPPSECKRLQLYPPGHPESTDRVL